MESADARSFAHLTFRLPMEGFEGLDDDLFDAHDAKPRQEASTSYAARICAPGWFSAPEYDHADLEIIKHRADTLYLSKQYQQCLDVVTRVIATRKESEKQRMWADMACRCHFALGQVEEALAEATALLHFDTTNDTTGRLLRARIEIALSKFPGLYSGSLVDEKRPNRSSSSLLRGYFGFTSVPDNKHALWTALGQAGRMLLAHCLNAVGAISRAHCGQG